MGSKEIYGDDSSSSFAFELSWKSDENGDMQDGGGSDPHSG